MGVPEVKVDQPIEVLRIVLSFDPCWDCATHVMRAEPGAKVFALSGLPGGSDGSAAIPEGPMPKDEPGALLIAGLGNVLRRDDGGDGPPYVSWSAPRHPEPHWWKSGPPCCMASALSDRPARPAP